MVTGKGYSAGLSVTVLTQEHSQSSHYLETAQFVYQDLWEITPADAGASRMAVWSSFGSKLSLVIV